MRRQTMGRKFEGYVSGLTVFACALAVRLLHCLVIAPRQLCGLNDRATIDVAANLAIAMRAANIKYFSAGLEGMHVGVDSLMDLLVKQGPIYFVYLASVIRTMHLPGAFDPSATSCSALVIANCLVDSVACVFIYLAARMAFNRRVAAVSAALAIIYPGFVLNNMSCYTESLGYALVSLWLFLACSFAVRNRRIRARLLGSLALGAVSLLIGFCVPSLILMPPIGIGLMLLYKYQAEPTKSKFSKLYAAPLAAMLLGACAAVAPWLWVQSSSGSPIALFPTGNFVSQLWIGGLLQSDGWQTLPVTDIISDNMSIGLRSYIRGLTLNPVPNALLLFTKVPRLWQGCWNDYQQSMFFLSPLWCNVLHLGYLFLGFFGFALSTLKHQHWRFSRTLPCVGLFVAVAVYHFAFCVLTPVSRNSITAMPAIIVLAAYGLVQIAGSSGIRNIAILTAAVALFDFFWLQTGSSLVPGMVALLNSESAARICDIGFVIAIAVMLTILSLRVIERISGTKTSIAGDLIKFGFFWTLLVCIGAGMVDHRWMEWPAVLRSNRSSVVQIISVPQALRLPDLFSQHDPLKTAYVFVDMSSDCMTPPMIAFVNGVPSVGPPIPWFAVRPLDVTSFEAVDLQSRGMGTDWRSLRQWWAIPVPFSAIKFGEPNKIELMMHPSELPISCTIYGDYSVPVPYKRANGSILQLPSPYTISQDKGFCVSDGGDIRLLEPQILQGEVANSGIRNGSFIDSKDLSFEPGNQRGTFKVRLALPINSTFLPEPEVPAPPVIADLPAVLYTHIDGVTVSGSDPKTFDVAKDLSLPQGVSGDALICVHCEVCSPTNSGNAVMWTSMSSSDEFNHAVTFAPAWAPNTLRITRDWRPLTIVQPISTSSEYLQDAKLSVMAQPYDAAHHLAHPDASKETLVIRNMKIEILPSPGLPAAGHRDWIIF